MKKFDFTSNLPTYKSSKYEKEYFLIFAIIVAGRNAKMATEKTWELLKWIRNEDTPFSYLKQVITDGFLLASLQKAKIGQYNRICKAIEDVVNLDVETCSLSDLEECQGIGPKTSRFFLMHCRKDFKCAVLDTHILKWLKERIGWYLPIPKSTPTGKKYLELEKHCVRLMGKNFPELTLAQADFEIWKQYAN